MTDAFAGDGSEWKRSHAVWCARRHDPRVTCRVILGTTDTLVVGILADEAVGAPLVRIQDTASDDTIEVLIEEAAALHRLLGEAVARAHGRSADGTDAGR